VQSIIVLNIPFILVAHLAKYFLCFSELNLSASICTWKVKMLIASFCSCAGKSGSKFIANCAFLVNQFFLLLIKVYYLAVIDVKNFIGP